MRKLKTRMLSLLLALLMLVSIMPADVLAQESETPDYSKEYVVLSVEGLTLGQGYYLEPQKMSYEEIGQIWENAGSPIEDLSKLTAAQASYAFFIKNEIQTEPEVTPQEYGKSSFYMETVKAVDKGKVTIPQVILTGADASQEDLTEYGNDDTDLGQFDYNSMTGWMITVDHQMINVGAGSYLLSDVPTDNNVHTIRWQYTIYGYGMDLGFGWGTDGYYTAYDKSELYATYADNKELLDQYPSVKEKAMSVMTKVDATEEEITTAIDDITKTKTINVNVYDYTAAAAQIEGASTNGVIVESEVTVPQGASALDTFKQAMDNSEIAYTVTDSYYGAYISSINDLAEFDGGAQSGWMVEYNQDGTNNLGITALTLKDGDTLNCHYSLDYGKDIAVHSVTPIFKTVKIGKTVYTLSSETTYDEEWNPTTKYYVNDGTSTAELKGNGTQGDPFLLPVTLWSSEDITKLSTSYTTEANSHYVTVEGMTQTMNLSTTKQVKIISNCGTTAFYTIQVVKTIAEQVDKPTTYNIAFDKNSSKATGTMKTMTLNDNQVQSLSANQFKRKGYTFAGWALSAKGKVVYKNRASIKNLTSTDKATVKLYAKWTKVAVKTASIASLKSNKKKAMTLRWKKVSGADGYVISYSTDKNMKKSVKKVYVSKSAASKTLKSLKAGKKYYVTVKAYEKDSTGKKVLGKCKAKKSITIKK